MLRRMEWKEEAEKAKKKYFRVIKEEEKIGYKWLTVGELINIMDTKEQEGEEELPNLKK